MSKPFNSPGDVIAFAKALFPDSPIKFEASIWDDGRSGLAVWIEALREHIRGQSYDELAAGIQRAHEAQAVTPAPDAISAIDAIAN